VNGRTMHPRVQDHRTRSVGRRQTSTVPTVEGTGAPAIRLILALLLALAAFLALTASPALAARGHVFKDTFGTPCAGEPCGPGELKDPSALAVNETTHNVYVADREAGKGRVEVFSASGVFLSEITGPAATGSGELTTGSVTVAGLATATGAFTVGEEIAAPGIEAGTTIVAIAAGSLELSAAATATESATLTAHQDFAEPRALAVDNSPVLAASPSRGDLYVVDAGDDVVDKFGEGGEYIGQIAGDGKGTFFFPRGVAVGAGGALWVDAKGPGTCSIGSECRLDKFSNQSPNGFESTVGLSLGGNLELGLAVDSQNDLYLQINGFAVEKNVIAKIDSSGHVLNPKVAADPRELEGGAGGLSVVTEATIGDVYVSDLGTVTRLDSVGVELESLTAAPSLGSASGVAVDAANETVYAADSSADEVTVFASEPPSPPTIENSGASFVTSTSARFAASINPHSEASETATTYSFEYGACASLTICPSVTTTPVQSLSPSFEIQTANAQALGLSPATTYRVRVVATNEAGGHLNTVIGPEAVFTTQSIVTGSLLPDSRVWELVSPPEKHGAGIYRLANGAAVIQASASGSVITYPTDSPIEADPLGYTNGESQNISRHTTDGWATEGIATPHEVATGGATGKNEYRAFSEDLGFGVAQPVGPLSRTISPEASEQTAFLRTNLLGGNPNSPCAGACYRPLVSGCPSAPRACPAPIQEVANVPAGTTIATGGLACNGSNCGPQFVGANSDLTHIVLTSSIPLTEAADDEGGLYEWIAGHLTLASLGPDDHDLPTATLGSSAFRKNTVSANGTRVVFSAPSGGEPHLYLRDLSSEKTIEVDEIQGGTGTEPSGPIFQAASTDDSRILFTDGQHLTHDSGGSTGKPDLFECRVVATACELTDLTPETEGGPGGGLSRIVAASEGLSSIYFVANGVLAANQTDSGGGPEEALPGDCVAGAFPTESESCNLYLRRGGVTKFITRLSGLDFSDWGHNENVPGLWTARSSPDGDWFAFMSQRPLTGYDNADAGTEDPDQEVFLYHATGGSLVCASCNPTGARPLGAPAAAVTENAVNGSAAAYLPSWTAEEIGVSRYQSRYLSDSGRLFFNANDALTPADTNRTWDVYQYEPLNVGGCAASVTGFASGSGGCVNLISSGTSAQPSSFLDASESGDDVFFLTTARLAPRDTDTSLDVYDASAGGAEASIAEPPAPCSGEACQASFGPPVEPASASSTFVGPGNPKGCPKGKVKKGGKCVKKKAKKHKKTKKSNPRKKKSNQEKNKRAADSKGRTGR
jgi:hypothetical protein